MAILNIEQGALVGKAIKFIQELQLEAPEKCNKEFLIEYLKFHRESILNS